MIDFIVFVDDKELKPLCTALYRLGCPRSQVMTLREFNHLPQDGFYDMYSDMQLLNFLKNLSIKTLLDADAHFIQSRLFTKSTNDLTEIDCIFNGDFFPLKENIFRHVYKNFSECALKYYDAALIKERTPDDFDKNFSKLESVADLVITFARNNSELDRHIRKTAGKFEKVHVLPSFAGGWFFCYLRKPPEDFAMYVVTHKKLPPEHVQSLPEGYKLIHAGRAGKEDLGYIGDHTGENISDLNPYLNEITALYWLWKNTSDEIVGLSHYRRFFTANGKNFLTREETLDILKRHDIIVNTLTTHRAPTREILSNDICNEEITAVSEMILRKNLMRAQPDYLDAFDYKMNSPTCFYKNMFVTRRPIFDAYCEWLFSFLIDSTREILRETPLTEMPIEAQRLPGHFAERMMTVWLLKNHLRIKELGIVELRGI